MIPNLRVRAEFDALYTERWNDTVADARKILRGHADPADVAATAYTRLWAEIANGRAGDLHARLGELTATIAETERTRSRRELEYLGHPFERVTDPDSDEPYETVLVREGGSHAPEIAERLTVPAPTVEAYRFGREFDAALRGLTDKQREAFVLTELRGLSTVEAAAVLGVTQSAVSHRRARALDAIRTTLIEKGAA